jgi:hypothetical protein
MLYWLYMKKFLNTVSSLFSKLVFPTTYNLYDLSTFSIYELRKRGYKVRCLHQRFSNDGYKLASNCKHRATKWDYLQPQRELKGAKSNEPIIFPRGGRTQIDITTPDKKNFTAVTYCSLEDNFCRQVGIQYCLKRLKETECCGGKCGCH